MLPGLQGVLSPSSARSWTWDQSDLGDYIWIKSDLGKLHLYMKRPGKITFEFKATWKNYICIRSDLEKLHLNSKRPGKIKFEYWRLGLILLILYFFLWSITLGLEKKGSSLNFSLMYFISVSFFDLGHLGDWTSSEGCRDLQRRRGSCWTSCNICWLQCLRLPCMHPIFSVTIFGESQNGQNQISSRNFHYHLLHYCWQHLVQNIPICFISIQSCKLPSS